MAEDSFFKVIFYVIDTNVISTAQWKLFTFMDPLGHFNLLALNTGTADSKV